MTNKYLRTIHGVDKDGNPASLQVDIYNVLDAYPTKNPALDHLVKKALCPGQRGHKDLLTDLDDIIASAKRAKELVVNRMACTTEVILEDSPELRQATEAMINTTGPGIVVKNTGESTVALRPTEFFGKTLCYYPYKLHKEGLLKTFQELAQKAGIQTRSVERADHVAPDGFLVDGPDPSENTIRRFIDQGILLYGVREACAILRGHVANTPKQDIDTAVPPLARRSSFKNVGTIYVFPAALSYEHISQIRTMAAGICRIERIRTITDAPIGSVVIGSYREEDEMIEGRHAYSAKEALEILAKDKQEVDTDA